MRYLAAILCSAILYLPAAAQTPLQAAWSEAELRANCIPVGETGLQARAPDCAVRKVGKVAKLGDKEIWYALYSNFPEIPDESVSTEGADFANVIVLFEAASSSDRLGPFRVSNAEGSYWNSFKTPQLFTMTFGSMLYIQGSGMGDGRGQVDYDQFLLWKDDALVELNALAWISQVAALLPSGHQLDAIYKDRFDLANLRYNGPVRRDGDCHTCATGGSVEVTLELQENSFVLDDFRYIPATAQSADTE